ncbi:MAG: GNAT family N-acetyltransferase [Pseudomonadota bacterium]
MSTSSTAEWLYTASQVGSTNDWHIEIFTDLNQVEADWLRLSMEGHAGPFQTVGWVSAWYEAAKRAGLAEPLIVAGSRRPGGHAEIILPLCIYKKRGLRIVSAPDLGVSDFYAPILSPALRNTQAGTERFFRDARKKLPAHDLIFIGKLDTVEPALVRPRFLAKLAYSAWSMKLGVSGPGQTPDEMKPKMRRTIRQKIKQMEKVSARAVTFTGEGTSGDTLDTIWTMRQERFDALGRPDGLKDAAWRQLYESVCDGRHGDLTPFSAILTCDDESIGAQFGIRYKNHFVGTLLSFRMGPHERTSPGLQVLYESMHHLAQQGVTDFDLSGGDQPYKRHLGCTPRPLFELMVPASAKGAVVWLGWRAKSSLRAHPRLFSFMKKLRQFVTRRH